MKNTAAGRNGPSKNPAAKGILYDATLCVGCLECEGACAKQNGLAYDDSIAQQKKQSEFKLTYVATFRGPIGIDIDDSGNLYVADRNAFTIRKIDRFGLRLGNSFAITASAGR